MHIELVFLLQAITRLQDELISEHERQLSEQKTTLQTEFQQIPSMSANFRNKKQHFKQSFSKG